jgi:hypothetical protein
MNVHSTSGTGQSPYGTGTGTPGGAYARGQGGLPEASPLQSGAPSCWGELPRDDPRVITALERYLEALRAGLPWSRAEFLSLHADIAEALGECLSGLEFIQAAAAELETNQSPWVRPPGELIPPSDWETIALFARSGAGGWALCTKPSRSRWGAGWP